MEQRCLPGFTVAERPIFAVDEHQVDKDIFLSHLKAAIQFVNHLFEEGKFLLLRVSVNECDKPTLLHIAFKLFDACLRLMLTRFCLIFDTAEKPLPVGV